MFLPIRVYKGKTVNTSKSLRITHHAPTLRRPRITQFLERHWRWSFLYPLFDLLGTLQSAVARRNSSYLNWTCRLRERYCREPICISNITFKPTVDRRPLTGERTRLAPVVRRRSPVVRRRSPVVGRPSSVVRHRSFQQKSPACGDTRGEGCRKDVLT